MRNIKTLEYTHADICRRALTEDNIFNTFKQIPEFTKILEHTSKYYADHYIDLLFNQYSEYANQLDWKKLKENDIIGNPNVVNFSKLANCIESYNYNYSPSTIYYIYRGLDIIDKILKNKTELNILEIGGGYGGQCKLLLDMCEMLRIKISSYGIIDLEYVSKLQNKYLTFFGYKNIDFYEFENLKEFNIFEKYNTLISIYALGEFEVDVQNFYVDNIIKDINSRYLIWNTLEIHNHFNNDIINEEVPQTGRHNKVIIKNENI